MDLIKKLSRSSGPISRYLTFKLNRNIMTTSTRAEKQLDDMKGNPYYEKYAKKIADLQQTSPEEFMSRMEGMEKETPKPKTEPTADKQFSNLLEPKKHLQANANPQDKPLDKIMKVDLISDKTAIEIEKIWQDYHLQKDVIAAVISVKDYDTMHAKFQQYPTFLLPLPRSQGYEFVMSQACGNTIHFTPLICYQVHKENAPECLTITHYTELKDSKGVVLMRGEFDKNTIDAKEAQCLANQFQLYYNGKDAPKTELLKEFSDQPDQFKHMNLIKQIEDIKLV